MADNIVAKNEKLHKLLNNIATLVSKVGERLQIVKSVLEKEDLVISHLYHLMSSRALYLDVRTDKGVKTPSFDHSMLIEQMEAPSYLYSSCLVKDGDEYLCIDYADIVDEEDNCILMVRAIDTLFDAIAITHLTE